MTESGSQIRCSACGWLNEPGARMCGGCGRPLQTRVPAGASGAYAHRDLASNSADAGDDDARTVADVPPMAMPQRRSGRPSARTPQPEWNAAPSWPTRRGGKGRSVLMGLLIAVLVVLLVGTVAWAVIARPLLHQQVDGAVRTQIAAMVANVNHQPVIPSATASFTAAQVTQSLSQQMPAGVPIQNVHVSFSSGQVTVTFTTDGFDGAVKTQLTALNGRLVARATEVDGPMALVESGDEMETALNDSLSGLRKDITVQNVTLDKDVMSVSVKGNASVAGQ